MDWLALLTLFGMAIVAVLCVLTWRGVSRPAANDVSPLLAALRDELARGNERIERELRGEIAETARIGRSDVTQQLGQFQQVLATQLTS
ncbi:recombinase RmuC, partial [Desulfocarbo indianensis]